MWSVSTHVVLVPERPNGKMGSWNLWSIWLVMNNAFFLLIDCFTLVFIIVSPILSRRIIGHTVFPSFDFLSWRFFASFLFVIHEIFSFILLKCNDFFLCIISHMLFFFLYVWRFDLVFDLNIFQNRLFLLRFLLIER